MQIVFVGPIPPIPGGIAQHSERLVKALREEGHTVHVISWRRQYPGLVYRGAQQATPRGNRRGDFDLSWWNVASWLRARQKARASDLLVLPYVTPFLAIPHKVISLSVSNFTVMVHNARPHEKMPLQDALARLAIGAAQRVVAHGSDVAAQLTAVGVPGPVTTVPMPATLDVTATPIPPGPRRMLFFGFVRPYKGLRVAVSAVAHLAQSGYDVNLTILGEFWESVDEYRKMVNGLGLEDRITISPGYATEEALVEALHTHQLVVAPYVSDTLSAVVPVAFAAGRPVLSTLVKGLDEQVTDDFNGILVAPDDPAALATGIREAFANIDRLAAGARATSSSWADVARAVVGSSGPH